MSEPVVLTLLAAEAFDPGQYGLVTHAGVAHLHLVDNPAVGTLIVIALEGIERGKRGRFEEVASIQPGRDDGPGLYWRR